YNLLNECRLFESYDKFNSDDNNKLHDTECEDILIPLYDTEEENMVLCNKLLKILPNFSSYKVTSGFSSSKHCEYFNFWLNDQVIINKIELQVVNFIHTDLKKKPDYIPNLHECTFDIFSTKLSDLEIINKLYIFTENIDLIKSFIVAKDADEDSYDTCRGYLQGFADLYNNNVKKCQGNSESSMFCNKLREFRRLYENELLYKFPLLNGDLPSLYNTQNTVLDSRNSQSLSQTSHQITASLPYPVEGHVPDGTSSSTKYIFVGVIVAALLGSFFTSFILYKFTPFGALLDSRIRRKKNMWCNMDEETHKFLHSHKTQKIYSDKKRYSIKYHSVGNS
ncbi:PIR Superfamily Protein, partial [Plasmodium ovale curtisi]